MTTRPCGTRWTATCAAAARTTVSSAPSWQPVMTIEFCPDGTVLVRTGKVELGQGVLTALSQIVADELGVDIGRIKMAPTRTGSSPDEGYTAGSLSIQQSGARLRQEAARLRATKPASRAIGKNVPRIDIPGKAFGTRRYVHDLRLPGQLFGRVLRPPSRGARLVHVDDVPGVVAVVRDGDFIGVVAEREEIAITALDKACQWEEHDTLPDERALPTYLTTAPSDEAVLFSTGV